MNTASLGDLIGGYRLTAEIARGGMGTVYKALDTTTQQPVALKVIAAELAAQPGYDNRFRREVQAAAQLDEPHILPVLDSGEDDGRLFLVMPLVEGADINTLLDTEGPMSPRDAVEVITAVASALDSAHAAGLVHRDVKPSNILRTTADRFVYLIDFGIAQDSSSTRLTSTGTTVGTWAYMAPERFTDGVAGAAADIYSLTCVLYQCLTGQPPYPGESLPQQVHGHCYLPPPKPTGIRATVPVGFDEVIARGMAKSPDDRYRTCLELAVAARLALSGPTLPSAPTAKAGTQPQTPPAPSVPPKADKSSRVARPRSSRPPRAPGEPPRPWSPGQLTAMIAGVIAAGTTGAALLIHQPTPFQDTPNPPTAAQPSTRAVSQSPPTVSTPPAPEPVSYPSDFTNQDRAFVDQALARGLATPQSVASLPDFAHWACTGFRDRVNSYLGIEDAALAWDDAKRNARQSPYSSDWNDPLLDLAIDNYCPSVRPEGVDPPPQRSPADTTFISGWYEMAPKRGLVVATAVMMRRAQEICAELQTTPDWEVIPHVDASMAGNNPEFKKKFVALARKSYCPNQ
jgi:serine/threonine protein kinase